MVFMYDHEDDEFVYFTDVRNNEIRFTKEFYKLTLEGKDEIRIKV